MIRVTRVYRLAASHRLHSPRLGEEENRALYGKCNNPYGHGHNYRLEISARGPLDESGRALDPAALDRLVEETILRPFDHSNLNTDVPRFQSEVPTTENFGREVYLRLKENWAQAFPGPWPALEKIRIAETDRNIFEVADI
jgi:6-pyruvoyltetrahydropterin/6-carboxytetrahydropterin synthase